MAKYGGMSPTTYRANDRASLYRGSYTTELQVLNIKYVVLLKCFQYFRASFFHAKDAHSLGFPVKGPMMGVVKKVLGKET